MLCRLAQADDVNIPIDIEIVDSPRVDLPSRFRERLALALRTTDASVLDAAERAYQGTWPTLKAFVLERLARELGTRRSALLANRDGAELLRYYEGQRRLIWSIPSRDAQCMVFELPRGAASSAELAALVEPPGRRVPSPVS